MSQEDVEVVRRASSRPAGSRRRVSYTGRHLQHNFPWVTVFKGHMRPEKGGEIVKRRILAILVAGALMAVGAAPAFGDAGTPGTTFPEQPDVQGCTAVLTNPGSGSSGVAGANLSPTAGAIVTGLISDACFGG